MANTFNYIQPPPNSTGLKIDTAEVVNGSNTVERQIIAHGDPSTAANVANVVLGANPAQGYSLVANAPLDGYKATYAAALVGLNVGTSATTDCFTIFGSGTKTIRVLRVSVSGSVATAAAQYDLLLQVCSAAPASGTATTATNVPYDSLSAAATALVKGWTVAPTAAAYVGKIAVAQRFFEITGSTSVAGPAPVVFEFGNNPGSAVVLRGTTQGLSLSLNGATPANATALDVSVVWTEE